jgi:hypothetical protein
VIYVVMAIVVPLLVAALVAQATEAGWLVLATTGFVSLLALASIGLLFSYDCFNADCGGRDDVAGWGIYIACAGLAVCGLTALVRSAGRRRKPSA